MHQLRDLLVDDLQDLLHAEMQLVQALPKLAEAVLQHPYENQVRPERPRTRFDRTRATPGPRLRSRQHREIL
jgi:ferritin-like metal-binding protein YciE